jgi:hypothetical protein
MFHRTARESFSVAFLEWPLEGESSDWHEKGPHLFLGRHMGQTVQLLGDNSVAYSAYPAILG